MQATLSHYNQSPRKVRLVANLMRGKSVAAARQVLSFLPKKSAGAMQKLLDSAVANARQKGQNPDTLFVERITVDKGAVLRRFKPMARGRATQIRRTRSIIKLSLGTQSSAPAKQPTRARKTAQ